MFEEASGSDGAGIVKGALEAQLQLSIFNWLMHEVKHGPPGARLSARLRSALERMRPEQRCAVVSLTQEGCAPLFVAAQRGNVEVLEYLVHVCDAPLEQRGVYAAGEPRAEHRAPPLWAAAVAGHVHAVRALADAGAALDAASDSGSTAVRSACYMSHLDVVRLLCERGADVRRPNHAGGTCLINAVQSPRLCRYLLERGADVDAQDAQLKTALHYAVQEHRAETVRMLLDAGASPHLASRAGDDALRTACVKGATAVVPLLMSRVSYPPAQLADALELLGATQLDEFNDAGAALASWRRATEVRAAGGAGARKRVATPCALLGGAREWTRADELAALAADVDAMRVQALLVVLRVLGPRHKDTLFRVMYRGAAHADSYRFDRCIDLWTWVLQQRIDGDTLLHNESCQTACALTRLLLDLHGSGAAVDRAALQLLRIITAALPECQQLISVRPRSAAQLESWERALRCVTHLIALADGPHAGDELRRELPALIRACPRTEAADTLLHLACSRLTVVRSSYFADEAPPSLFPSVRTVNLLLECGADAAAVNEAKSTPLHVAAVPYNFSTELVEALLNGGGHLDTPNKYGDSAAELIPLCRTSRVCVLRHVSLACLAARAAARLPHAHRPSALPATLAAFLRLHTP